MPSILINFILNTSLRGDIEEEPEDLCRLLPLPLASVYLKSSEFSLLIFLSPGVISSNVLQLTTKLFNTWTILRKLLQQSERYLI